MGLTASLTWSARSRATAHMWPRGPVIAVLKQLCRGTSGMGEGGCPSSMLFIVFFAILRLAVPKTVSYGSFVGRAFMTVVMLCIMCPVALELVVVWCAVFLLLSVVCVAL